MNKYSSNFGGKKAILIMKFYHIKIFSYNWTQKKDKRLPILAALLYGVFFFLIEFSVKFELGEREYKSIGNLFCFYLCCV